MRPIITVENVSKEYQIGALDAAYTTLRDAIVGTLRAPLNRLRTGSRGARIQSGRCEGLTSLYTREKLSELSAGMAPVNPQCSRSCRVSLSRRRGGLSFMDA